MDKKKVILIGVALIAIVIIICGATIALVAGTGGYDSKIAQGYRLIEQGDFNGAVLCFEEAISLDAGREDAYLGLYNAYVSSGNYQLALSSVRRGVDATGGAQLLALLPGIEQYVSSIGGNTGATTTTTDKKEETVNTSPVLNTELLSVLGGANYGDYTAKYGAATVTASGNQYHVRVAGLPATLIYFDTAQTRVIDPAKGIPYNTYLPNEIVLDDVMVLFGGGDTIAFNSLRGLAGASNVTLKETTVTFTYYSCTVTITCDSNQMISTSSANKIVPASAEITGGDQKLNLTVRDATTGKVVSGAKVTAYEGYNTTPEAEGTTDGAGAVKLELKKTGNYTLKITKDGYIEESFNEYIVAGESFKSLSIVPQASGDVIRFVVTWGSYPQDLDAYLRGTAADGTYVDVDFTNMTEYDANGKEIASLDVDDRSSFGPETVTLYNSNGKFEFMVTDYNETGMIGSSQAQVKIYVGSSLYTTVNVPAGATNGWHVCQVVNGEITVTNRPMNTRYGQPA